MKEGEGIQEIFDRFNDILNGLKALGKTYSNSELVRKGLRALPKSWKSKKDVILELKVLNNLALEALLGSLLTHQMGLNEDEEQVSKGDKRIGLPLKSKVIEESKDQEEEDSDEETVMYARRFKHFIMKSSYGKRTNTKYQSKIH